MIVLWIRKEGLERETEAVTEISHVTPPNCLSFLLETFFSLEASSGLITQWDYNHASIIQMAVWSLKNGLGYMDIKISHGRVM